ncbi:MAG: adenosylcobinamide-GDP ribazoletransferase, partial [Syntrophales bacterium]
TALPYVRREGGLATAFGGGKSLLNVLWASAFLLAAGWTAGHWVGFTAGLSALLVAALFSVYCFRKIGGYTGDTLGAGCELTEIIPAIAAVVLMKIAN